MRRLRRLRHGAALKPGLQLVASHTNRAANACDRRTSAGPNLVVQLPPTDACALRSFRLCQDFKRHRSTHAKLIRDRIIECVSTKRKILRISGGVCRRVQRMCCADAHSHMRILLLSLYVYCAGCGIW